MFQSTPARGGRRRASVQQPGTTRFQSTPARGGRRVFPVSCNLEKAFQSTPARGGRRFCAARIFAFSVFQSTPARGGRRCDPGLLARGYVSIHARARRATASERSCATTLTFQSTPARGGRQHKFDLIDLQGCFNPRPRAAGDVLSGGVSTVKSRFNPRPRAAGDLPQLLSDLTSRCFNPRPRAAGDHLSIAGHPSIAVSIHARARRATAPP